MTAKSEEKEFDRPGQLNKDNVNPNAKHTNPPNPPTGEMLSINEPPGSQPGADAAAGNKEAQQQRPSADDTGKDDDDDNGGKKRGRHR